MKNLIVFLKCFFFGHSDDGGRDCRDSDNGFLGLICLSGDYPQRTFSFTVICRRCGRFKRVSMRIPGAINKYYNDQCDETVKRELARPVKRRK